MKKISLMLTIFTLLASASTSAMAFKFIKSKDVSCGVWSRDRRTNADFLETWLMGYLSGVNAMQNADATNPLNIYDDIDSKMVALWMDRYCMQNPLKGLSSGMLDLSIELIYNAKENAKPNPIRP